MSDVVGHDSDRLSGWEEIARHLRRSVRSAQRWERELGMPVEHVRTLHGVVVQASRAALDTWLEKYSPSALQHANDEEENGQHVASLKSRGRSFRHSTVWVGAMVAVIAASAFAYTSFRQVSLPDDQALFLSGRVLEVRERNGRLAWSHRFDRDVTLRATDDSTGVMSVDLDDDGWPDWVVSLRFSQSATSVNDVLYAFNSTGNVMWTVDVKERQLTCGGETFRGPWSIDAVAASAAPDGRRVWVAFNHHTWWPSFVIEVTPDRRQVMRYVQSGWVLGLTEWQTDQGAVLAAGGVLNEHRLASVVVVDPHGPPSMLPATESTYACDMTGTVAPRQAVLLPVRDAKLAVGHAYDLVGDVSVKDGRLHASLYHDRSGTLVLTPDGRVDDFYVELSHTREHELLWIAGTLDHHPDGCPYLLRPELRVWTPGTGWSTLLMNPAVPRPSQQRRSQLPLPAFNR